MPTLYVTLTVTYLKAGQFELFFFDPESGVDHVDELRISLSRSLGLEEVAGAGLLDSGSQDPVAGKLDARRAIPGTVLERVLGLVIIRLV